MTANLDTAKITFMVIIIPNNKIYKKKFNAKDIILCIFSVAIWRRRSRDWPLDPASLKVGVSRGLLLVVSGCRR